MTQKRLTPAQRRVLSALESQKLVRRRGAFGTSHADLGDARFAASRTIDALWRNGLVRPAEAWGAFELSGQAELGRLATTPEKS